MTARCRKMPYLQRLQAGPSFPNHNHCKATRSGVALRSTIEMCPSRRLLDEILRKIRLTLRRTLLNCFQIANLGESLQHHMTEFRRATNGSGKSLKRSSQCFTVLILNQPVHSGETRIGDYELILTVGFALDRMSPSDHCRIRLSTSSLTNIDGKEDSHPVKSSTDSSGRRRSISVMKHWGEDQLDNVAVAAEC